MVELPRKSYVYILECGDTTLYTGWTTNLKKRCQAHQSGQGAKYTRARLPVRLIYFEEFADKRAAMRREAEIKAMSREQKLDLIAHLQTDVHDVID